MHVIRSDCFCFFFFFGFLFFLRSTIFDIFSLKHKGSSEARWHPTNVIYRTCSSILLCECMCVSLCVWGGGGCVGAWVVWVRGWCGCVGGVGAWVVWLCVDVCVVCVNVCVCVCVCAIGFIVHCLLNDQLLILD